MGGCHCREELDPQAPAGVLPWARDALGPSHRKGSGVAFAVSVPFSPGTVFFLLLFSKTEAKKSHAPGCIPGAQLCSSAAAFKKIMT